MTPVTERFRKTLAVGAACLQLVIVHGCSKKEAPGIAVAPTAMAQPAPRPGNADCYKVADAKACPPNPADPSGLGLPTPGASCNLPPCGVCGSASVAAFRDFAGAAKPGWCICVTKSDDSGQNIYSCFGLNEWQNRGQGGG